MTPRMLALALALPAALSAQNGPLIGYAGSPAGSVSADIIQQTLCTTPRVRCTFALPVPSVGYGGGATYNHTSGTVYHTDGSRLIEQTIPGCRIVCRGAIPLALGAGSLAGGLTFDPARRAMMHVESTPGIGSITVYGQTSTTPCPQRRQACRFTLPTRSHRTGAIAFDSNRGVIYVAASVHGAANPQNVLYVFKRLTGSACNLICRITVTNCLQGRLQAIRAMTYDACRDLIYISDGRQTSVQQVSFTGNCPVLRPRSCCPLNSPTGQFWYGFDLWREGARSIGRSCTSRPCNSCPNMTLSTTAPATLANSAFGFRFDSAPSNSIGYVFLNGGPCTSGFPIFCGRFYPRLAPPPAVLPPIPLPGTGSCGGRGAVNLPLPNDPTFCGVTLCAQGAVVCRSPIGIGLGLTNALQLTIQP